MKNHRQPRKRSPLLKRLLILLLFTTLHKSSAQGLWTEDPQSQISSLQSEIALLQQRNAALEADNKALLAKLNPSTSASPSTPQPTPAQRIVVDAPTPPPPSLWKNEISVGGSVNRGNVDSYEGTIQDQNDRITALDKLHFGFLGDFKSLQGSTVADRGKGEIQYDHQISGPLYDFARGSLERDDILDLTYRANMGPGLGYFLVKTDQMTWAVESGPGMQAQKYHEMGEDTTAQGVLLDHFNWQVTKTFHLFQNLEFDKDLPDIGGYRANYDVGFEAAISQKLHVRLTGNDRYNAQPVEGTKRNDLGIVTSLVWDF